MSQTFSISAKRRYGLTRVCRQWHVSRATLHRHLSAANRPDAPRRRRGPQGSMSDTELGERIHERLPTLAAEIREAIIAQVSRSGGHLAPNLGVVQLSDFRSFVIADIPGLIEGAHEGRGLGTQFLRHVERTRTLALLIPVDDRDPQATYRLLRRELREHDAALAHLPHCVVLSKADLLPAEEREVELEAPDAWDVFLVSAATGEGVDALKEALWARVREEKERGDDEDEDLFPELEAWTP